MTDSKDRITKLKECIEIAKRCGNSFLERNLNAALREEYKQNNV
jgi:hypothetical protein